ncbi:MAG: amidohydrolase family protein [Thermoplasmata archaeon]
MKSSSAGRWIFTPEGLTRGFLRIEEDRVAEICYGVPPSDSQKALILPGFVNAHTHIGDSVAFPAPRGSVEEIVGPPDGYKYRVLASAPVENKIDAMRVAVEIMNRTGCSLFVDFREESTRGIEELESSLSALSPYHLTLGRPVGSEASEEEIDAVLKMSQGFGMSAVRDWPLDFLQKLARKARGAGKLFAIHASETEREDIESVLSLRPSFLVHMVKATQSDLEMCADARVPIVVCPRSSEFFGLELDIPRLLRAGVVVGLGTDNGMISRPDMISELQAAYGMGLRSGGLSPQEVVNLATFGGHKVLNAAGKILTEIGIQHDLVIVRVRGDEPLRELVTETRSEDVVGIVRGGRVRRTETWTR